MITREEALQTIHDCRITSLGELAHGYTIYQATANILINQLFDQFEAQLSSNPLQLTCESCVQVDCPMYLEAFNYYVVESKNDFYCNFYSPKDTK